MEERRLRLDHDPARIRRRRVAARLELTALARLAKISKSHLSKIENGLTNPSPIVLGRIADALDCTVADLMAAAPEEAKSA